MSSDESTPLASAGTAPAGPRPRALSPQVRDTIAALADLLGAEAARPPLTSLAQHVGSWLGLPVSDVVAVTEVLSGLDVDLLHVAVAELLNKHPPAAVSDDIGTGSPGYEVVAIDVDCYVSAPFDLAALLPAGTAFAFATVLVLGWQSSRQVVALHVHRNDGATARDALAALLDTARTTGNFYRGKTLQVEADDRGTSLRPVPPSSTRRADVVLPERVWREVDETIGGLARHGDILAAAGLGAARGVLLVGPPGVGKTALCRAIAAELPVGTTVLLVDATVSARGLGRIFESVELLAPAAVVLDDIDLVAGDRRSGTADPSLREFLVHLDGFQPPAAVITLATTNVTETIDPALIRPGRFDSVIEIRLPDRAGRADILRRYLAPFGTFDVETLAARTDGASGADLREIVRRAVLERGAELSTEQLGEVIGTGRWRPAASVGQYL